MEQTSLSIDPAYIGHLKGEVDIIPEDVSVLSFDGIPYTEKLNPSMTTICQPVEFQAERIINGMLYLLDGKERKSDDTGNDYVLQIRDSTGVPRE